LSTLPHIRRVEPLPIDSSKSPDPLRTTNICSLWRSTVGHFHHFLSFYYRIVVIQYYYCHRPRARLAGGCGKTTPNVPPPASRALGVCTYAPENGLVLDTHHTLLCVRCVEWTAHRDALWFRRKPLALQSTLPAYTASILSACKSELYTRPGLAAGSGVMLHAHRVSCARYRCTGGCTPGLLPK